MDIKNVSADISWLDKDVWRYKKWGTFIPIGQIHMYEKIRDHWTRGRTVIDLGCSAGYGSNILSHQARHVWGVDVNQEALDFAKHMFERPNLSFDHLDLENPPERPLSPFEVVVMIEVLEHLPNFEMGLQTVKRFFSDKLSTVGFITVPNLGNSKIAEADAKNELHIQHWQPGEFYELMTKHFQFVTLYSSNKLDMWEQEETTDGNDTRSKVIIAKVEGVI